jgi:hypothetical protein
MLVTLALAAWADTTDPGSGFVFITILGYGMIASGLLLISAAIGARRLVAQGAAVAERKVSLFFGVVGVIGLAAALYGFAVFGVVEPESSLDGR